MGKSPMEIILCKLRRNLEKGLLRFFLYCKTKIRRFGFQFQNPMLVISADALATKYLSFV